MIDTDVDYASMVKGVTSKNEGPGVSTKEFQALYVKSIDEKGRRITACASSKNMDRHGEIVLPTAFKERLNIFMENPVVLSAHMHRLDSGSSPVVGNTIKAWIDKAGLWVVIEFHDETELAREYWRLYSKKIQRAFSIGFMPIEWEDVRDDQGRSVRTHTLVELIEISCVPVPSNRESLSRAKQGKRDFVRDKRGGSELSEYEKRERDLLSGGPETEKRIVEFAEALLGVECNYSGDSTGSQTDCDYDFTRDVGLSGDTDLLEDIDRAISGKDTADVESELDFSALVAGK